MHRSEATTAAAPCPRPGMSKREGKGELCQEGTERECCWGVRLCGCVGAERDGERLYSVSVGGGGGGRSSKRGLDQSCGVQSGAAGGRCELRRAKGGVHSLNRVLVRAVSRETPGVGHDVLCTHTRCRYVTAGEAEGGRRWDPIQYMRLLLLLLVGTIMDGSSTSCHMMMAWHVQGLHPTPRGHSRPARKTKQSCGSPTIAVCGQ